MSRRILVSGNCQAGPIAAALQRIFPGDAVSATSTAELLARPNAVGDLAAVDWWVATDGFQLSEETRRRHPEGGFRVLRCPTLLFTAFHPDVTYLMERESGRYVWPHYNSRIGAWAYLNGVEPADAARRLFTPGVFSGLGYFDRWREDVVGLTHHFGECELDFAAFLRGAQRQGSFMHVINHPKPDAIVGLAKLLAAKLGATPENLGREIVIPDALHDVHWPVYPAIADRLGLEGGYDWTIGSPIAGGLRGYLEWAFGFYRKEGLTPETVEFVNSWWLPQPLGEAAEAVLRQAL